MRWTSWLSLSLLLLCNIAHADVTLHPLFTDSMVLQREKPVPVWGTADPQEKVVVSIGNQAKSTQADAAGNWRVVLKAMPAAQDLTLSVQGDNRVTLNNVAVGDVYLCSGQSNMEFGVGKLANAKEEIAAANYPNLRLFMVPHQISGTPQKTFSAPVQWKVCTPENIAKGGWNGFSAVAYFFGRELSQKLGVPIGLIQSSWGGTVAQAWTSRETLLQRSDFHDATLKTEERLAAPATDPPAKPNPNQPTVLYNGMIAPLLPFAVRGVIWYQGESNAGQPAQYRTLFPDLIRDWRAHWNAKQDGSEFGFYFVQLANFMARTDQPVQSGWAELRDAQTHTLKVVPRTGMATIIDIGEAGDIHPKDKQDVGKRLALAALAVEYGRNIEYSGPMFYLMEMEAGSNKVRIHFTHAEGLKFLEASLKDTLAKSGAAENPDVPLDHWAYNAINKLYEALNAAGIVELFPNGTYSGGRAMTRYEFAVALARLSQNIGQAEFEEWKPDIKGAYLALLLEFRPEIKALGVNLPAFLDAPVKGFAIQDQDGKWHTANARIEDESVLVWNDEVPTPKAVAYAWANNPEVNLVNAAGLPAVPFRTDAP